MVERVVVILARQSQRLWRFCVVSALASRTKCRRVRDSSASGLAGAGIALYSVLREAVAKGVEVNVTVYGLGNSAASLVVQAVSEGCRFMTTDAWMLIHSPY